MTKPKERSSKDTKAKVREEVLGEVRHQLALDKFQEERPQLWLQSQRVMKLVEVQAQLENDEFAEGSCFLHANTVAFASFCLKKVVGIDLDTCQVTLEIYGDEHLEAGVVVVPLETIEWFGFPAKAVPTGIHFQGFTHHIGKTEPAQMMVDAGGGKRGRVKNGGKAGIEKPKPDQPGSEPEDGPKPAK
jgi:hypothetical protein